MPMPRWLHRKWNRMLWHKRMHGRDSHLSPTSTLPEQSRVISLPMQARVHRKWKNVCKHQRMPSNSQLWYKRVLFRYTRIICLFMQARFFRQWQQIRRWIFVSFLRLIDNLVCMHTFDFFPSFKHWKSLDFLVKDPMYSCRRRRGWYSLSPSSPPPPPPQKKCSILTYAALQAEHN